MPCCGRMFAATGRKRSCRRDPPTLPRSRPRLSTSRAQYRESCPGPRGCLISPAARENFWSPRALPCRRSCRMLPRVILRLGRSRWTLLDHRHRRTPQGRLPMFRNRLRGFCSARPWRLSPWSNEHPARRDRNSPPNGNDKPAEPGDQARSPPGSRRRRARRRWMRLAGAGLPASATALATARFKSARR